MFTGIISEFGELRGVTEIAGGVRIEIANDAFASTAETGASIAIDGCCLTVANDPPRHGLIQFELSRETMSRTIASGYAVGSVANMEPSLRLGDSLGGHMVTGHVDLVGTVANFDPSGEFADLEVSVPGAARGMIAEKGSVAVNGVSLTVAKWRPAANGGAFQAALIPETLERTNLGRVKLGDRVNIEYDLIARYVVEVLSARDDLAAPSK